MRRHGCGGRGWVFIQREALGRLGVYLVCTDGEGAACRVLHWVRVVLICSVLGACEVPYVGRVHAN